MTPIQNPKSKIQNLLAFALIAGLVALFFWRIITPRLEDRAAFPPGDFTDQFWMFRVYAARAFAQGRLPLWSENFNSGHPFLADVQSAIFYPVGLVWTLIVVALRGDNFTLRDLELEAIFHFMLAGVFTYLFAQRMLQNRIAALVSALTFTFSGYLTSYPPQQLAILETATWLPLTLYFLDRGVTQLDQTKNPRLFAREAIRVPFDFIFAGVTLGIAILAGHPQTVMFVAYASVIFFVWRIYAIRNTQYASRITHHVLHFALSLVIAFALSAVQWLPTLEYQLISTRAAIGWAEASRGFPTLDPLQMILPGFINAFQSPLYIGIVPLWLALFALLVNRTREKNFWALLALGSLIVAFGFYAFGFAVLYLFAPGFALFRGQERLALVIAFALALLAGYGMRELMQTSLDVKRARRAWGLLPAGIVISLMFVFTLYISGTVRQSSRVAFLGDRAGLMVVIFILATVLIAARLRQLDWRVFAGCALALIAFDLFSVNNSAYNASIAPRFPVTPIVETIQNDPGLYRVVDEGQMPGHFGIAHRLEEIGGISPLRTAWYDKLRDNVPEEKLWALLNVRYIITERPGFANADVVTQDAKTRLLRLNDAMPRAWFVASVKANADDATALAAMSNDVFDPRAVAYLAGDVANLDYPDAARNSAQVVTHAPERLVIEVNAPVAAMLLVSQVYYPGWRVLIDGVPAQLYRADVALMAVAVPAGAHRIELIFEPGSVQVGMGITIVTLLLIVASAVWTMKKR